MTPERWKTIEDIFQSALDCPSAEREKFVREKSGDDIELRREVEKLIARYEADKSFLESPVWTDSALFQPSLKQEVLSSFERLAPPEKGENFAGRTVGVYRLTEELGRGGMGMVCLAERADGEFRQKVAVKLIKRGMDTDFIVNRFRHERQILASLNHPNIARLLDGGTTDDDLPYFVMEYIEGESFFTFCEKNKFDLRRKIEIFLNVCEAVAYAHKRKIIHRDIKPTNILVAEEGTPKLLDFGIAKIFDPDLIHESISPTETQMRLMTPEYASPEQVRGDEITTTSDQYSLGVLLYELITGIRPYKFTSRVPHEIARIICEEEPLNFSSGAFEKAQKETGNPAFDEDFCKNLDRIVLKTLRKNPTERYDSVKDFADDLRRFLRNEAVKAESFPDEIVKEKLPQIPPVNEKSIAVLPFKILDRGANNETGEAGFLTIGMADAVITRLSNIPQLIVRPTSSVLRFGETGTDSFAAGEELNVRYILDGGILYVGEKIRFSVQLLDVTTQSTVWAERFDEFFTDVLSIEDVISTKVAESVIPQLTTLERQKLAKRGTDNPEAYESYLRGRFYWNTFTEDGFAKAFVAYHEAIACDPNYALAFAGIADYYNWLGVYGVLPPKETYQPAQENAKKAIELDDKLAEAFAALGFAQMCGDFNWESSVSNINRAIELSPHYAAAHNWLAIYQFTTGRFDEAIENAYRAVELDPLTYQNHRTLFWGYYFARRFREALATVDLTIKKFPMYGTAYLNRSWVLRAVGRMQESLESSQKGLEISDNSVFLKLGHAQALAAAGNPAEAERLIENTKTQAKSGYVSHYHIALTYCYAHDREKSLDALEQAWADREGWLVWLAVEPAFDFLRGEPRFQTILEKINHPLAASHFAATIYEPRRITAPDRKIITSEAKTLIHPPAESVKTGFSAALKYAVAAGVLAIFGLTGFFVTRNLTFDFSSNALAPGESWSSNFASTMNIKRLTDSGQAQIAAVSPDGRQIAYVLKEDDRQGVWVREIDSNNARQLVAPDTVLIAAVNFSPDGKTVFYTAWGQNFIARNLYRIPVNGNALPQLVLEQVNNGIGFSPDGRQIAYVSFDQKSRKSLLHLAETGQDGAISATRILAEYSQPNFIRSNPSFAPDGRKIVFIIGETVERKDTMSVCVFDLAANSPTKIGERTFGDVSGVVWRNNGGEIVISAAERDGLPYQLWAIAYPSGKTVRLTNDFSSYFDVGIARDSKVLVTAKREKSSAVWIAELNAPGNAKQITAGADRLDGLNGVSWTADNRILYVGGIGSNYSLLMMNADGSNNRPLDVNVVRPTFPSLTADKRHVIFADSKEQGSSVWRYNTQSGALEHLTPNFAVSPTLSPDGKFVFYSTNNSARKISLHKIPVEGGTQTEITSNLSASAAVSPDGKLIACYYSGEETGNSWRLAVLSAENGKVIRVISPPDTFNIQNPLERPLDWSPDSRSVYYVNDKNSISNIFRAEAETEKPSVQITNFTTGRIFDFSLSPDGRQIAFSRGAASSDIVIFQSLR